MRASVVVLSIFLAGCSSGGSSGDNAVGTTTSGNVLGLNDTLGNLTLPVAVTDTLFLLRAPSLGTWLPDNETILATQAASTPQSFAWNLTANSTGNLTGGRLTLWILLPRSAVQSGAANDPACTLSWRLVVTFNGTQRALEGGCASLGTATIPPGEYSVNITTPPLATAIEVGPGADLRLQITLGFVVPNGQGYLMGGTPHFNSHLQLGGLAEPVNNTASPPAPTST